MEKWFVQAKKADFTAIGSKFHIDPVIARVIRNRDIVETGDIDRYLNGTLSELHSPWLMKDMGRAAEIIMNKIQEKKKIRVIGDYDIDGVNATYILLKGISRLGGLVDTDIPDRMKDGYGINENLIESAKEAGIDTIVTCDNGIAAFEQITYGKSLGMTVIITDHHDIPYTEEAGMRTELLPPADAIVNPKQKDCPYPFKELCGAAVAWKLVGALYEQAEIAREEWEKLVEYAAIATVGDVMDLVGENRILVKEGLKRIRYTDNKGLDALMLLTGVKREAVSAYHIGFVLGPCINAGGRLDTAKRALSLLECETEEEAGRLAGDLKNLNDSRKAMTMEGVAKAIELIEAGPLMEDKVLLVYLPDCHESLAGIIAGRIRERYHKPVIVFTDAENGAKGSGRSIEAYNMYENLARFKELYSKFGGHPMAAGLSLPTENIDILRKKLNDTAELCEEDFIPKVLIDVPMPVHYLTEELIGQLSLLEPFGKGNPKPVFAEKDLLAVSGRILGKNKNVLKLVVKNTAGCRMEAMHFGDIEAFERFITEKFGKHELDSLYRGEAGKIKLSVTYYPDINEYNGSRSIQIVIQNYC